MDFPNSWHDGDAIECAGCNGDNLHPLDVISGAPTMEDHLPYYRAIIRQEGRGLDVRFETGDLIADNRARELDTSLRFTCERCMAITEIKFLFHKGSLYAEKTKVAGAQYFEGKVHTILTHCIDNLSRP